MAAVTDPIAERSDSWRLVRAYLQCLGLGADPTLDRLSERVLALAGGGGAPGTPERAAVELVLRRTEAWLRAVSERTTGTRGTQSDPLAGWRLAAILSKQPDALLHEPTEAILEFAAALWDSRTVPETQGGTMPDQALGGSPATPRTRSWRAILSQLVAAPRGLRGG